MVRVSIWKLTRQLHDYSIMSSDTYAKKFKAFPLQNTDVQLKTYSGETLKTCGQMLCEVSYNMFFR